MSEEGIKWSMATIHSSQTLGESEIVLSSPVSVEATTGIPGGLFITADTTEIDEDVDADEVHVELTLKRSEAKQIYEFLDEQF